MQIISALFVENFALRTAPGPSTRIDLTGAFFSMAAPSPVPVTEIACHHNKVLATWHADTDEWTYQHRVARKRPTQKQSAWTKTQQECGYKP